MEKIHLHVEGMASSHSKTALKNALEKLYGVQTVAVDLGEGTVEVGFNGPAHGDAIRECIINTGYTIS